MRHLFALASLTVFPSGHAFAQAANEDPLPQVYTMTPTGVNLQTGHYEPSFTDLSIGHLKLVRGGPQSSFGNSGIKHNLAGGLYTTNPGPGGQPVLNIQVDGKTIKWTQVSTGDWVPWNQEATTTALSSAGGNWKLIGRGGETYQFMPHPAYGSGTQVLQYTEYADGTRQDYTYNSLGLLRTLISNRGYAIVLDYGSHNGVVTACGFNRSVTFVDVNSSCAAANLKVSYGYTQRGTAWDHTSVTDVDGNVTTYKRTTGTYAGLLECITLANSQTCRVTNSFGDQPGDPIPHTKPAQVRKQVMVEGAVWLFDYENQYDHEIPPQPGVIVYSQSFMTDPLGNQTTTRYGNGEISDLFEPGGRTTQYDMSGSDLVKLTYPEGNILLLSRDGDRIHQIIKKAKPGSGLADTIVVNDYPSNEPVACVLATPKLCDKPTRRTDALGNQTDYTYDPANGQMLTETAPAVNGVRAQTRYTYAQRYAWIKNSGGSYVQAATPIWVLTQKSICKTGAASGAGCATGSDEVRTTYDYGPNSGPNNLLLRGIVEDSTGLSLRTCYAYDGQGNKISETKPAAGLASCP